MQGLWDEADQNEINAGSVDSIIYEEELITIYGWAICKGQFATRIEVFLNNQSVPCEYTLGLERPDVAEALGNPSWRRCGWKASIFTFAFDSGQYPLSALAYDLNGKTLDLPVQSNAQRVIVNNFKEMLIQSGRLEGILYNRKSKIITFRGWAISNSGKAKKIEIEVNGFKLPVKCYLGLQRPEIASSFNHPEWINCGWIAQIALDDFPAPLVFEEHMPVAFAVTENGERWPLKILPQIRPLSFSEKQLSEVGIQFGSINRIDYGPSPNTLEIEGWVVSNIDPVDNIEIYIDSSPVAANVTFDLDKTSAANSFGYDERGEYAWRASITSDILLSGCHRIFAFAVCKSGYRWQLNNRKTNKILAPAINRLHDKSDTHKIVQAAYVALLQRAPSPAELEMATSDLVRRGHLSEVIQSVYQSKEARSLNSLERNKNAINFQAKFLDNEKIVFLHIPKTGGTTLSSALSKYFLAEEIFECRDNSISVYSSGHLARYRFFSGHFDLPNARLIPGNKKIISFFREPISRLVSHYYFYKAMRPELVANLDHRFPSIAHKYSLADFFKSAEIRLYHTDVDNLMTRMLTGNYSDKAMNILPQALNALNDINVFGIMERYDESARLIFNHLKLPKPDQFDNLNVLDKMMISEPNMRQIIKEPLTDEIRNSMSDLVQADLILYSKAQELFEKRLQEST